MRRITLPADADAVEHVSLHIGSPLLRGLRESAGVVRFVNDSTLSARETEAIRHFSAAISSCGPCNAFRPAEHFDGYDAEALPDEFYENILDYRDHAAYSDRERMAVEFCSRYWTDHRELAGDDPFWERLRSMFTEAEIADLCILAGLTEAWAKSIDVLLGVDEACMLDGLDRFEQGGRASVEAAATAGDRPAHA
jgi:alkylhydroperoxidase family enzyme